MDDDPIRCSERTSSRNGDRFIEGDITGDCTSGFLKAGNGDR